MAVIYTQNVPNTWKKEGAEQTLTISPPIIPDSATFPITNSQLKSMNRNALSVENFRRNSYFAAPLEVTIIRFVNDKAVSFPIKLEKRIGGPAQFLTETTLKSEERQFTVRHKDIKMIAECEETLHRLVITCPNTFSPSVVTTWIQFHKDEFKDVSSFLLYY